MAPLQVFAQADPERSEKGGVTTMGEVVVTGTRYEKAIEKIPANVTVIDEEEIENAHANTLVELLRYEEGIVVRDLLGNGKSSQVDLRGFGETGPVNNLVLVDGRRVNEIDLSGADWTQIPLEQIARVEIVRGTGTVLYGDNAVGGVINIITKTPGAKPTFKMGSSFGSYSRSKELVSINGGRDRVAASLYASYDATHGYRENNEFRAKDVGGKIVFDPSDFLSLNVSGSYHSDDFGLAGDLTKAEMDMDRRSSSDPFDNGQSRDAYLKLGFELDGGKWGNLISDLSYRDRYSRGEFPDPLFPWINESDTETWAITPRYLWNGKVFSRENAFIAGVDLYRAEQDIKGFSGFFTPVATLSEVADIERDSVGCYFNNEFSISDKLILSLGARREKVKYELSKTDLTGFLAPLKAELTEREYAYSAGLLYIYAGKSSVFARVNRSFRFPLTDEIIVSDFIAGTITVNTDLKPQRGYHYEIGIRHYFTPSILGRITLFRADIKDEIFLNRFPAFSNENHPETLHQGIEVGVRCDLLDRLTLYGNYTYEKATFEDDPFEGNDIPGVPKHKANLGFQIYNIVQGFVLSGDYNYVSSSYAISDQANQFEKLDHYQTINSRLSYEWKWLKAFAGVNNITGEEYSEYAILSGVVAPTGVNFYPAPERNWVAGIQVKIPLK
jgi:iron complex outermembrane receptor protein